MVRRRRFVLALAAGAATLPLAVRAQRPAAGLPRIGYLSQGSEESRGAFLAAFRDGLREFGWVDGRNVIVEVEWGEPYRFPQIAAELVRTAPAVIIGTCVPSTRAAKNATTTIPVVMSVNGDPVASKLVASLGRPGANVTGRWTLFEDLVPKWLEFLTAAAPRARTIAVLVNPASVDNEYWWARAEDAARRMKVSVARIDADKAAGLEAALAGAVRQGAGALIVMVDGYYLSQIDRIVGVANLHKLPAIYGFREYAEAGGLMSYGLSYRDHYREVARYVDSVLRGVKPADLPVQQATTIELTVNLATARSLGVAFPNALLARASRRID